jgi:hypothetical protein
MLAPPIDWSVNRFKTTGWRRPRLEAAYPGGVEVESGTVLILITLAVLPVAAVAFARSGPLWRSIGRGPLAIDQDLPPRGARGPAPPVDPAIQAAEARQMIEAKSYRRQRRGEAALDVEAELREALVPTDQVAAGPDGGGASVDAELRAEVRRLVVAGNERRLRRGEARLDVEEETERQLADLIGSF